jgi:arylsulfatase A-like enzyme
MKKFVAAVACLLILFSLWLVIGNKSNPPNIVLISIDTLRGDYFNPRDMPRTYSWAAENCLVFTNAHSNSTWTKPSHLTLLTGLIQSEHRVEYWDTVIPENIELVQAVLQRNGYHTSAFVSGGFVSEKWGFGRGFDEFTEISWDEARHLDVKGETFRWAEERLQAGPVDKPIFMFIHTYMVHQFWAAFLPDETLNPAGDPYFLTLHSQFDQQAPLKLRRELYAKAVDQCDRELISFISSLVTLLPKDNTHIMITSDHGEGLGEKYEDGYVSLNHTGPPYFDQTHVPLIISGLGADVSDRLVGNDDIAGTILMLSGIEENPDKSIFKPRDDLIAEHIPPSHDSKHRYVATIKPDGRQMQLAEVQNDLPDSSKIEMTDDLKRELKTLGYVE